MWKPDVKASYISVNALEATLCFKQAGRSEDRPGPRVFQPLHFKLDYKRRHRSQSQKRPQPGSVFLTADKNKSSTADSVRLRQERGETKRTEENGR